MIDCTYSCVSLTGLVSSETQAEVPPGFLRDAEVEADRLGVPDVQIAVGLRREPRDDLSPGFARVEILRNDLADEVPGWGLGTAIDARVWHERMILT